VKKIGNFGKLVEKEEQQLYLEIWGVWISELFFALAKRKDNTITNMERLRRQKLLYIKEKTF